MSRNSRPWQDQRHHVKIIEGDINEGNRWYATAVVRLKFLLSNQPGSVTDVMQPTSDVTIRVDTRPNRIHIKVNGGGIYMESGFIDMISYGKCVEAAYRPGTLNYNAKVTTLLGSSDTPVQGKVKLKDNDTIESPFSGEVIADGAQSLAVGCKESAMLPTVVTPFPCTNTYSNGGYCGLGLQQRKDCMVKVPASMYSGKLRLFVQAMYGSTREDFSYSGARSIILTDQSGQTYQNPKDGTITLSSQGINQSYWLYTIGNGGYALCYMQYPNIVMIPLLLPDIALKFAEAFATHPNNTDFSFKTKIEAYLLAYAVPVYDSSLWLKIPISGPMPAGDPLSHGWHVNWTGNEAHIVTFYAASSADRFTSNQYKLTITQTEINGAISFSAEVVVTEADKDWSNWTTGINLFYYDENTQQMMALAKPGSFPPAQFTFDAPVYCFTMLNPATGVSDLVTVRVYYTLSGAAGQFSIVDTNGYSDYRYALDDYWAMERTMTFGTKAEGGIKTVSGAATVTYKGFSDQVVSGSSADCVFVGGKRYGHVPVRPNNYYGAPGQWFDQYGWGANDYAFDFYQRPHPSGSGSQYAYLYAEFSFLEVESYNKVSTTRSFSAYVEAFFGDADAVNFGVCQTKNNSSSLTVNRTSNPMLINSPYQILDMGMMEAKFDTSLGGFVPTGTWLHKASDTINVYCQPMGNSSFPIGYYGNPPSGGSNIVKETAGLNYTTDIKEIVDSKTPETALKNSSNGDARYFAPTLSSPGTGTIDYARASIQSGAISEHTLYTKDYGFIKNTSVGWA